jgi:hypothetical protein
MDQQVACRDPQEAESERLENMVAEGEAKHKEYLVNLLL